MLKVLLVCMHACVCVSVYGLVHMCVYAHGVQKRTLEPFKLEYR